MWIHHPAGFITATLALATATAPVADAFDPPSMAGSAPIAATAQHGQHVSAHARPVAPAGVSERVWQEINDALAIKLGQRS